MATKKENRGPKYKLMLILKDEYKKEGKPDNFTKDGNNLEKLLLFAQRHTDLKRRRIPWQYVSLWRNTRYTPYEPGERLLWQRLAY